MNGTSDSLRAKQSEMRTGGSSTKRRKIMNWNHIKRLIVEEEGMEMIEWAIVGVVFAVAGALAWGTLATNVDTAIGKVETAVAG
jgi:Flp pilus assembly pilin Flp